MKVGVLAVSLITSLLFPSLSSAQCSAPDNPDFRAFQGKEDKQGGHFAWYSGAAPNPVQGGGHGSHSFERWVRNLGTTSLKFKWPVGRMSSDALLAGRLNHFCYDFGWPNQIDGPLHYGRGNEQTPTTVWEGKGEPKEITSTSATFAFNASDSDSTQGGSLTVLTSFRQTTAGMFAYAYSFESNHARALKLRWGVERDTALINSLRRKDFVPEFAVEGKKQISVESKEQPTIVFRALSVSIEGGVTEVEIPILIPRTIPQTDSN